MSRDSWKSPKMGVFVLCLMTSQSSGMATARVKGRGTELMPIQNIWARMGPRTLGKESSPAGKFLKIFFTSQGSWL